MVAPSSILYADRTNNQAPSGVTWEWEAAHANEVKTVVNDHASCISDTVSTLGGAIYGMGLAVSTGDPLNDLDIAAGGVWAQNGNSVINQTGVFTKQLDAPWVTGTDQGGLFVGASPSADTWYHVFAVKNTVTTVEDYGFDTSEVGANIPGGFNYIRRIGSVLTDSSGQIIPFTQEGDEFLWDTVRQDFSGAVAASSVLQTVSTPLGVRTWAQIRMQMDTTPVTELWINSPDQLDWGAPAPGFGSIVGADMMNISGGHSINNRSRFLIRTDESGQIRLRASTAVSGSVMCFGYIDRRGKDL